MKSIATGLIILTSPLLHAVTDETATHAILQSAVPNKQMPLDKISLDRLAKGQPPLTRSTIDIVIGIAGSFFSYTCKDCDDNHEMKTEFVLEFKIPTKFKLKDMLLLNEISGARVILAADGTPRMITNAMHAALFSEKKDMILCQLYASSDLIHGAGGELIPAEGTIPLQTREIRETTPQGAHDLRMFEVLSCMPDMPEKDNLTIIRLEATPRRSQSSIETYSGRRAIPENRYDQYVLQRVAGDTPSTYRQIRRNEQLDRKQNRMVLLNHDEEIWKVGKDGRPVMIDRKNLLEEKAEKAVGDDDFQ